MKSSERPVEGARALDRALDLLALILHDQGQSSLGKIAGQRAIPMSTAHRLVARFEAHGLLLRVGKGRYRAGFQFARLAAYADRRETLVRIARPFMRQAARDGARTLHLGVLEGEMITYLVKESGGGAEIFTREAMQLEAYCSAIGKVLLAALDETSLAAYLASGPLVPLTERTLTDPDDLRRQLLSVRSAGYAVDDGEVADGVACLAVPIRQSSGDIVAALSSSGPRTAAPIPSEALLASLRLCADKIQGQL